MIHIANINNYYIYTKEKKSNENKKKKDNQHSANNIITPIYNIFLFSTLNFKFKQHNMIALQMLYP